MNRFWCCFFIFWPILAVLVSWYSPDMDWWFPGEPGTPIGSQIDDLFYLILVIVTVVFIGTQIALCYVLWTGVKKQKGKALFTHGSHNLEVIWTIVPSGILMFISLYQLDVWKNFRVQSTFPEAAIEAPVAEVTARQFEWRIRYPAPGKVLKLTPQPDDLYTVNDLHVPTNRPIVIQLRSGDVQHSFFVPDLRIKQDAVPGQVIPILFEVLKGGDYDLTCAELCGWGHYKMRARVLAQPESEFNDYLLGLQQEQNYDGVADEPAPSLAQQTKEVRQ